MKKTLILQCPGMVCSPPVVSKCLGEAHRRLELFTLFTLHYITLIFHTVGNFNQDEPTSTSAIIKAILTPRARFPYCKLFGWGGEWRHPGRYSHTANYSGGEGRGVKTPRARFPYCKLFGWGGEWRHPGRDSRTANYSGGEGSGDTQGEIPVLQTIRVGRGGEWRQTANYSGGEGSGDTQGEIPILQTIRVGRGVETPRARFPYCKLFGWGGEWRHPGRDSHTANFLGAVPEHLLNFWGGAEWTPRDPA